MTSTAAAGSDGVGQFYDRVTDLYTDLWDENLHVGYWQDGEDQAPFDVATEQLTDQLIVRLAPQPGQRVLDVGCGVGKPAISLARAHNVEVVGISVSRHQVARANVRAHAEGLADRVRFEYADAAALPFPDASFDAAWAIESLLHMPDKHRVLGEIARVLRPASRLVLSDMFHQTAPADVPTDVLVSTVALDDYPELLRTAGLTPLEIKDLTVHTVMPPAVKETLRLRMLERQAELTDAVGTDAEDPGVGSDQDAFDYPGFGYAIITAQRVGS